MTAPALAERAACAALFWARRRDEDSVRGSVAGLADADKADVTRLLEAAIGGAGLDSLSDDQLLARMLDLGAKSAEPARKILGETEVKSVATIGMGPVTDASSGTFSGYLAAFSKDLQGDTIMGPAAVAASVAALNNGQIQWHLTDSHSDLATDVVATVTSAAVDSRGVLIQASWMPGERAQALRKMVNAGAKLGLSIDYLTDSSRPDPSGGRYLDRITICGGACTPKPMNSLAVITEGKSGAYAPIVDLYDDLYAESQRRDPDRQRAAAEDQLLAAVSWPPRSIDRDSRLALIRGAAAAKAVRLAGEDDGDRIAAERRQRDNAYSYGLAAWMAAHKSVRP